MINIKQLRRYCGMSIAEYRKLGETVKTKNGLNYTFIDNGANILAVAHLDTVLPYRGMKFDHKTGRVYTPVLDDRLGAYIISDLLPKHGVLCDILYTEGEESGRSTGEYFVPPEGKEYNWIFEFDRAGTDVVLYDYEEDWLVSLLHGYGFDVGIGSFSDISTMEHLGVKGMNIGCGYHGQHTLKCYADVSETAFMVKLFLQFYRQNCEWRMPHTYNPNRWKQRYSRRSTYNYGSYSSYGGWADEALDYYDKDGSWEDAKESALAAGVASLDEQYADKIADDDFGDLWYEEWMRSQEKEEDRIILEAMKLNKDCDAFTVEYDGACIMCSQEIKPLFNVGGGVVLCEWCFLEERELT